MSASLPTALPAVIAQLRRAWNTHDLAALAACYHPDYRSEHPLHPERGLTGIADLERSWAALFEAIPGFQAELLRWAAHGDTVWTEWRWSGDSRAGSALQGGGVMVFGLAEEHIAWMRAYTEMVPVAGPDWESVLAEVLRQ